MSSIRPNLIHVGWVRLDLCDGLGWIELNFFKPPWWVGLKNLFNPIQPDPLTPLFLIIV